MKRILFVVLILLAAACSEKDVKKIEVSNVDAFAYQLDKGWELNGSAIIKNFSSEKSNDKYTSKLSYYVNLTQPDSSVLEEADYGVIDISENEEVDEHQLDLQIELDSGFSTGKYELLLVVMDDLNGTQDSTKTNFELTSD